MSVTLRLGTPFREIVAGKSEIELDGKNLAQLFASLEQCYNGSRGIIFESGDELKKNVHLFVNGEDFRVLGGMAAPLKDGDVVSVLFAIDGG